MSNPTDTNQASELDEIVSDLILDLTDTVDWEAVSAGVKAGLAIRAYVDERTLEARISTLKKLKHKIPNAELSYQTDDYLRGYRESQSKIGFELNRLNKLRKSTYMNGASDETN